MQTTSLYCLCVVSLCKNGMTGALGLNVLHTCFFQNKSALTSGPQQRTQNRSWDEITRGAMWFNEPQPPPGHENNFMTRVAGWNTFKRKSWKDLKGSKHRDPPQQGDTATPLITIHVVVLDESISGGFSFRYNYLTVLVTGYFGNFIYEVICL